MNIGSQLIALIQANKLITSASGEDVKMFWSADAEEVLADFVERYMEQKQTGPADELRQAITQQIIAGLAGGAEATAAHLNQSIRWYGHIAGKDNDDLQQMFGDYRQAGGKLPPVDTDSDDPVAKD